MKAILFVDDEPNILSGLKRMLRSMRKEFDLHFAESGQEGLQIMSEHPVDVVVSDMRMPGMDGAEFLTEVQQRHPAAVRIMLTGQADDESVLRTVSVVHQFLTKPCEPERLKEVIVRSASLHDLMVNTHLKEMISGINVLPSIPNLFARLQEALKSPDVTADEVAAIIEQDIAMTAKILQLVNSSFFGLYTKIDTISRAVKLLGLDTVKILVLGIQIFTEMKVDSTRFPLDSLWTHSMLVAQCAKKISMNSTEDLDLINNSFIAGLLHDIGRLLLLSTMTEDYLTLVEKALEGEEQLLNLEQATYMASHAEIGAYLASLWGFPGSVVEAVGFHHNLNNYPGKSFTTALAVHIADYFYYQHCTDRFIGNPPQLNIGYIETVGFSDRIESWSDICKGIIDTATEDDK